MPFAIAAWIVLDKIICLCSFLSRTKVFIRNPKQLYEIEDKLAHRKVELATLLQAQTRKVLARKHFMRVRAAGRCCLRCCVCMCMCLKMNVLVCVCVCLGHVFVAQLQQFGTRRDLLLLCVCLCVCVCVCVYVCMCVCMLVRVCVYVSVCVLCPLWLLSCRSVTIFSKNWKRLVARRLRQRRRNAADEIIK